MGGKFRPSQHYKDMKVFKYIIIIIIATLIAICCVCMMLFATTIENTILIAICVFGAIAGAVAISYLIAGIE